MVTSEKLIAITFERVKSPSKRRAAFKAAQERLSYEYPVINKENEKPNEAVTMVTTPTTLIDRGTSPPLEELIEMDSLEEIKQPSCKFGVHLWNDLYQPKKSCDIIGNEEGVARVYNWLSKWKYSNPKGTTNPPLIPVIPVIPVIPDNSDPDFSIPIRHRSRIVNNSMNSSFN